MSAAWAVGCDGFAELAIASAVQAEIWSFRRMRLGRHVPAKAANAATERTLPVCYQAVRMIAASTGPIP